MASDRWSGLVAPARLRTVVVSYEVVVPRWSDGLLEGQCLERERSHVDLVDAGASARRYGLARAQASCSARRRRVASCVDRNPGPSRPFVWHRWRGAGHLGCHCSLGPRSFGCVGQSPLSVYDMALGARGGRLDCLVYRTEMDIDAVGVNCGHRTVNSTREATPTGQAWVGRRLFAAVDAAMLPVMWVLLIQHAMQPAGLIGPFSHGACRALCAGEACTAPSG